MFHLRTFFKLIRLGLFGRRFRLRRWAYVFVFTGIYLTMFGMATVGRALDHVIFFRFRKQAVKEPIFIISNPRSGTTFLHRLMCLDDQFATFKLHHTIFPSLCHHRFFALMGRLDRRIGGRLSRLLGVVERRAFRGWKDIHPMGFNRTEEDEGLFIWRLATPGLYLLFPYVDELRFLGVGDHLPPRVRKRLMGFYRSSIQRLLHSSAPDKRLLSKNVLSTGRVRAMLETFPDAHFIYLARHPKEAVPSFVSMFYKAWNAHSPDIPEDSPECRAFAELAMDLYRHIYELRDEIPDERLLTVTYKELIHRPEETVTRVYDFIGVEMSESFTRQLREACRKSRSYRSAHEYSLEQFGLTEEVVEERLGDVIRDYGLEETGHVDAPKSPEQTPREEEREDDDRGVVELLSVS